MTQLFRNRPGRKAIDLTFEILKYIPSLTENRSESRDKSQSFRRGSFTG
jgi:hypothetical protein